MNLEGIGIFFMSCKSCVFLIYISNSSPNAISSLYIKKAIDWIWYIRNAVQRLTARFCHIEIKGSEADSSGRRCYRMKNSNRLGDKETFHENEVRFGKTFLLLLKCWTAFLEILNLGYAEFHNFSLVSWGITAVEQRFLGNGWFQKIDELLSIWIKHSFFLS